MCLQATLALPDTDNVCIVVKEEEKKEHTAEVFSHYQSLLSCCENYADR